MRFVYTISRGASDPTGMSIPLHMAANGSLEVGHEVTVLFMGDGTDVFVGDNADRIQGVLIRKRCASASVTVCIARTGPARRRA